MDVLRELAMKLLVATLSEIDNEVAMKFCAIGFYRVTDLI